MDTGIVRMTPDLKRRLMSKVGALKDGLYRLKETPNGLEVAPVKNSITRNQQLYWFAAIVTEFSKLMMEHDAELSPALAMEAAHYRLKEQFLAKYVFDKNGVVIAPVVPSLMDLSVAETSVLIDKAIGWLAKDYNIIVPTPEEFGVVTEKRKRTPALSGK